MRRIAGGVVVAIAISVLPACGSRDEFRDQALRAVARTEGLAHRFVYEDSRPPNSGTGAEGQRIRVQGLVEDDFRYKAAISYDGETGFEEVVSDDVIAVRFIDPRRVGLVTNKDKVQDADLGTDVEGLNIIQALETRRWVVDPAGAPARTAGAPRPTDLGIDPLLDAITVMSYVEGAVREAGSVERWSPDDLTPAYSKSEDDFPKPEDGSGVIRYDLHRPALPQPGNLSGRSEVSVPSTRHFRRMAIYVKKGRVIQVIEAVDLRGKYLEDFFSYFRTFLREAGAGEAELEGLDEERRRLEDATRAQADAIGSALLHGFAAGVEQFGADPILIRRMRLDLRDLGGDVKVELPLTDVVRGELGILRVTDAGKESEETESETAPEGAGQTADDGSSTPAG